MPLGEADEAGVRESFARELITPMRTRGTVVQKDHDTGGLPNEVVALLRGGTSSRRVGAAARWLELAHDRLIDPILSSNDRWLGSEATQLTRLAADRERLGVTECAPARQEARGARGVGGDQGRSARPARAEVPRRGRDARWVDG